MLTTLLHLLSPALCDLCEIPVAPGEWMCAPCETALPLLPESRCNQCARPWEDAKASTHRCGDCLRRQWSFDRVHARYALSEGMAPLLHRVKFGRRPYPLRWLVERNLAYFRELLEAFQPDLLVPMPLSWRRNWWRGFNQSHVLAEAILRETRFPAKLHDAVRRAHRDPQARKKISARLSEKFFFTALEPKALKDRRVFIIDDILTTGATADALSRCLKRAGASAVEVLVLARAISKEGMPP